MLPACTCECKCGKAMASMLEEERVHQFLMGLNHKKYNTVRTNILSQGPSRSLNKAYAAIVSEERQLQFTQFAEPRPVMEGVTFKAMQHNRPGQNHPKCSYCQKLGHERHQCYEPIGCPAIWGNRHSNKQVSSAGYGGGSGNTRSSNPRNWGTDNKS